MAQKCVGLSHLCRIKVQYVARSPAIPCAPVPSPERIDRGEMPNEPESRRNTGETAIMTGQANPKMRQPAGCV